MARFYGILAVLGWVWLPVALGIIVFRVRRLSGGSKRRGFEVINRDDSAKRQ